MVFALREKLVVALLSCLYLQLHTSIVSGQCLDYTVIGESGGIYNDTCMCDIQVAEISGCSSPPSQAELDEADYIQTQITNISLGIDALEVAVQKSNAEIETTQEDMASMTSKLDRIESGDLKINQPEFELIVEEIEVLESLLVLLEAERVQHVQTLNSLQDELNVVNSRLFDLRKTQDLDALLEEMGQLEADLAECRAGLLPEQPPGSEDDGLFVPWSDKGSQDSCADIASISSPYVVRTDTRTSGAWMRDPNYESDYIWHYPYYTSCSSSSTYKSIYRYRSFDSYERQATVEAEIYSLPLVPHGPGLVAYNGSFYFVQYDSRTMYRSDVTTGTTMITKTLDGAGYSTSSNYNYYIYREGGCSDFDFAVDENGLWVIYSTSNSATYPMQLAKLDPVTLDTVESWSLNYPKNGFDGCFMVCAQLYCTDQTKINFRFNTLTGEVTNPNIPIRELFGRLYTLDYNPRDQKLYGWDNGNMVVYDVTFQK